MHGCQFHSTSSKALNELQSISLSLMAECQTEDSATRCVNELRGIRCERWDQSHSIPGPFGWILVDIHHQCIWKILFVLPQEGPLVDCECTIRSGVRKDKITCVHTGSMSSKSFQDMLCVFCKIDLVPQAQACRKLLVQVNSKTCKRAVKTACLTLTPDSPHSCCEYTQSKGACDGWESQTSQD